MKKQCPFCQSARVWSFGPGEWRCEKCTQEWNGNLNAAAPLANAEPTNYNPAMDTEDAIIQWWDTVKDSQAWSAFRGMTWDELWPDAKEQLTEIYNKAQPL